MRWMRSSRLVSSARALAETRAVPRRLPPAFAAGFFAAGRLAVAFAATFRLDRLAGLEDRVVVMGRI